MEEKTAKINITSYLPLLNIAAIFLGLTVIIIRKTYFPEKVPFFYSRPWGEDQLANSNWLFIIPLSSLIFFIISSQIGKLLTKKGETLLTVIFSGSSLLFSVLGIITIIKIVVLIS